MPVTSYWSRRWCFRLWGPNKVQEKQSVACLNLQSNCTVSLFDTYLSHLFAVAGRLLRRIAQLPRNMDCWALKRSEHFFCSAETFWDSTFMQFPKCRRNDHSNWPGEMYSRWRPGSHSTRNAPDLTLSFCLILLFFCYSKFNCVVPFDLRSRCLFESCGGCSIVSLLWEVPFGFCALWCLWRVGGVVQDGRNWSKNSRGVRLKKLLCSPGGISRSVGKDIDFTSAFELEDLSFFPWSGLACNRCTVMNCVVLFPSLHFL